MPRCTLWTGIINFYKAFQMPKVNNVHKHLHNPSGHATEIKELKVC